VSISIHRIARSPTWAPAGNVRLKLVRDAFVPATPARYAIAMRYSTAPGELAVQVAHRRRSRGAESTTQLQPARLRLVGTGA
jgi:hypothetical protein